MTVHNTLTSVEDAAAAHSYLLPLIEFMAGDVGILNQSFTVLGENYVFCMPLKFVHASWLRKKCRARKNVLGKNEQATKE